MVKNEAGEVTEIHCTYDPASRGGNSPDGRKVKSTIHWVSAEHGIDCEARLYENLFREASEDEVEAQETEWAWLTPNSMINVTGAKVEPCVQGAAAGTLYQFERVGYFCVDKTSTPEMPVFNRTVALRDSWAKIEKGQKPK